MGELGNQLFQYAFLRTTARRLGVKFCCPEWIGDRIFMLNDQQERVDSLGDITRFFEVSPHVCGYTKEAEEISDGTDVAGYFQSERYFDNKEDVRRWYTFRPECVEKAAKRYGFINFSESVSVSARLGDSYEELRDRFPLYSIGFYEEALRKIKHKGHVLIFSDHQERARKFFRKLSRQKNVLFVDNENAVEDLFLISQCHDNIITNSTFSWWGAWLNRHPDKTVVIPMPWFRSGQKYQMQGIECEGWTKVAATNSVMDHYFMWNFLFRLKRKIRTVIKLRRWRI